MAEIPEPSTGPEPERSEAERSEHIVETTEVAVVIDAEGAVVVAESAVVVTATATDNGPSPNGDLAGVLGQVRERGFITTGEIFAAFPDLEPDTDELRDLYDMFESRGVKVLDEIAAELELEDQRRAGASPAPAEPAPRAAAGQRDRVSTDPRRRAGRVRPVARRPRTKRKRARRRAARPGA